MAIMTDTPEAQAPPLEQKSTSPKDLKADQKADLNGHKSPSKAEENEPSPNVNGNGTKPTDHEGPNGVTPTPEDKTENKPEDKTSSPGSAQASSTPAAAPAPVEAKDGDVEMADTPADAAPAKPAATNASEEVANKSPAEPQPPVTDSNEAKTGDAKPSDATPPEPRTTDSASADTGDAMAIDEKQEPSSPPKEGAASPPKTDAQPSQPNDGGPMGMSQLAIDEPQKAKSPSADQGDVDMSDAPPSAKVAREREDEDDGADEPLAKRAKTEQSEEEVQVATQAAAEAKTRRGLEGVENWNNEDIDRRPITPYRVKEFRRLLAGAKKTKAGAGFRDAVGNLWPGLKESYEARIERPMHLGELERRLRDNKYETIGDFKKDLALLYLNSLAFNGELHDVTASGLQVVETVYTRCLAVPEEEPPRPKHAKQIPSRHHEQRSSQQQPQPTPTPTPAAAAAPAPGPGPGPSADVSKPTVAPVNRPPSKPKAKPSQPSRRTSTAASPVDDARGAQTFAVPPGGVPQIRRASTHADGDRPKRAIHPPKSKDLDYADKPLSRKNLKPELQFCDVVLREIMDPKHYMMNAAFLDPVDPVSLGIPDYFKIIKKPMDLGTISKTLGRGGYQSVKQFQADMDLMFNNCFKFNMPGQPVYVVGEQLQSLYHSEMGKKAQWLAKHAASKPASVESPAHSDDEDEGEAEIEAAAEIPDYSVMASTIATLQEKLQEETAKLNSLYMEDVPNEIVIKLQHTVVSTVQESLLAEKKKLAAIKQDKPAKTKASKPNRPKPAAGGAGGGRKAGAGGAAKKSGGGGGAKKAPKKERTWTADDRNAIATALSDPDFANIDQAITIIKKDTGQAENNGVLELDIDQLSMGAIAKLWDLCSKTVPGFGRANNAGGSSAADASSPAQEHASGAGRAGGVGGPSRKKNKPMKAREQEERINQLMAIKEQFHATGKAAAASPKAADESFAAATPTAGHEDDSSDTSDSEEE